MDAMTGLAGGFAVALTFHNLAAAIVGALLGTAVGVTMMSPSAAMAILLALTLDFKPETGIIMMAAMYFGAQYGDSLTAILLKVPSEAVSIVIAEDGYALTRRGRHGAALGIAAVSSFTGATIGLIGVTLLGPVMSRAALAFGSPDYLALMLLAFVVILRVTGGGSLGKGVLALGLGLAVATIGADSLTGVPRFTFGNVDLRQSIDAVPVVIGLFGFAEVLELMAPHPGADQADTPRVGFRNVYPTRAELKEAAPAIARGGPLGFLIGMLPGPSVYVASVLSYALERRIAKDPSRFGTGAIRGIAGPKAADDGGLSGTLVPLLSLGLPFTAATSILFAGLTLHGVTPGPLLVKDNPDVFWGVIAAMYVGNVVLLVLNLPLISIWTVILRIPPYAMGTAMVLLMLFGVETVRNSLVDVLTFAFMGVIGYFCKNHGVNRIYIVLGVMLGPVLEQYFRQSLQQTGGDLWMVAWRPIAGPLFAVLVLVLVVPVLISGLRLVTRRPGARPGRPMPEQRGAR